MEDDSKKMSSSPSALPDVVTVEAAAAMSAEWSPSPAALSSSDEDEDDDTMPQVFIPGNVKITFLS